MPRSNHLVINFFLFQAIWWLAVVLTANSIFIVSLLLIGHILLHPSPRYELLLIGTIAAIGFGVDSLLTLAGVFQFPTSYAPLWLAFLWLGFASCVSATTFHLPQRRFAISLVFGLLAPFSYYAAKLLGAVQFGFADNVSLFILALVWLPLSVALFAVTEAFQSKCIVQTKVMS